jgi:formyl-CoA transferase
MVEGVPSAPVLSVSEVMHDPHFRERGSVVELDHPTVGKILVPGSPLHLGASDPISPRPAPELDQHTDSALADILGLSEERLAELRAARAIGQQAGRG